MGLALLYWPLGFLISLSSLSVYLEYAAYFPNRSGAEVVYLEQAYPRPIYLFPVAFAFQTVILSFSSGNSIGGSLKSTSYLIGVAHLWTFSARSVPFPHQWSYAFGLGVERDCDCGIHGRCVA